MTQKRQPKEFPESRTAKALQALTRASMKMEEKIDKMQTKIDETQSTLGTLVTYYKEIKELETSILKGLK